MTLIMLLGLAYVFAKFGGFGLSLFGVKLAQFSLKIAFKYFKIVLIVFVIFVIVSFIQENF